MTNKKHGCFASILILLLGYILAGFGSLLGILLFPMFLNYFIDNVTSQLISLGGFGCLVLGFYLYIITKSKKYNDIILKFNLVYIMIVALSTTIIFVSGKASLLNQMMNIPLAMVMPMFPLVVLSALYGTYVALIVIGFVLFFSLIFSTSLLKQKKYYLLTLVYLFCASLCFISYFQSPNYKYRNQNHGFEYMSGFSSTDFSDYHVYSKNSQLATLDHEPEFMIEHPEDMPVMDGAEACYPLYAAIAKTLYKNIDSIELDFKQNSEDIVYGTNENGSIVTFYNTAVGFERLVQGDVDLFFGAKPSASQLAYAEEAGVELVYTPIGKEAFVFFVEEDNPVDSLTTDQIRSIYHGDITNWKEVGGNKEEIIAFQRPERSGSQSMMIHFMNDVSLKEPLTYEMEHSMMGIIENVAQYQNEKGAIGYSFRYFLEGLNEVENIKMIKVNGIYPSNESIQNGTYPIVATVYCITVKNNDHPYVQKVIDFMLSEDGQSLIEMTGYSPLN